MIQIPLGTAIRRRTTARQVASTP